MISAIIPTYHALRYLPACLIALEAQLDREDEIILIDNASRDRAADYVERHFPRVRLIRELTNRGFAGGCNRGFAAARGEWLLLINDDALLEPGGVAALRSASADAAVGAVGGLLLFARRPEYVASAGITQRCDGVALDAAIGTATAVLGRDPTPIFGASGGLALLRRELLNAIGAFDEGFESYLEDVDLAWRARLQGWQAQLAPAARARHVYSATGGQNSPRKDFLLARNRLRVLVRCWPSVLLREHAAAIAAYDGLALLYAGATRRTAIIEGRVAALRELPRLRAQRALIQQRRSASIGELAAWLAPAPSPLAELRQRRALAALLR